MRGNVGGRYLMQQRMEIEEMPLGLVSPRGPLIERLNAASLAAVAEFFGVSVDVLVRRYV